MCLFVMYSVCLCVCGGSESGITSSYSYVSSVVVRAPGPHGNDGWDFSLLLNSPALAQKVPEMTVGGWFSSRRV